jgi:hypothetical protein
MLIPATSAPVTAHLSEREPCHDSAVELVRVVDPANAKPVVSVSVSVPVAWFAVRRLPTADLSTFVAASLAISALTNAVVATCVVLVPTAAVGAAGVPVSVGELSGAFADKSEVKLVT